ncbi:MAG: PEGA domain-containing protein, partial [Ignavibacteriales bacterium]|nr:PEGA domain-containing protein [Ignavibacteriales bacterium]
MTQLMKSSLLLFAAALLFSGCATIMHGTHQEIEVSSSPSGARVWVDNNEVGVSPLFVEVKRSDEHILRIELSGYQRAELTITKRMSGWLLADLVVPFAYLGLPIDLLSGALYTLTADKFFAELEKEDIG